MSKFSSDTSGIGNAVAILLIRSVAIYEICEIEVILEIRD